MTVCRWDGCSDAGFTYTRIFTKGEKVTEVPFCRVHWSEKSRVTYKGPRVPDRYVTPDGYIRLRRADGSIEAEHRIVMEETLGRPLVKGESVHHRNGLRHDNRPENLELWVGPVRHGVRGYDLLCPHCGVRYYEADGGGG